VIKDRTFCQGTGGDEAALFALEVFGMYENMARSKGWKFEILDIADTELKGCKVSGRRASLWRMKEPDLY
jgi:protein subunit release factor A